MPFTVDPTAFIVGAGQVYNRPVGSVAAWSSVGGTIDDTVARIVSSWFAPDINGMLGPVQGGDYKVSEMAEIEFTMVEVAGSKLALAIPGATATTTSNADATGTPGTTTLAAAAAIGDTAVKVTAITNFSAGDYIQINVDGVLAEYRQVDVVGTAGAGGTGLQFRDPLLKAHANSVAVVETVGDGKTVITGSAVRRMPDTAYSQWAVVAQAPAGYYELLLNSGISSTDTAEIAFGDETIGGIRATIQGRKAGASPTLSEWFIRTP